MKPIKVGLLMMGALLAGCTDASEPTTDEAREREQLEKQLKAIPGAEKRQVLMPDFMPMMGQLQECQGRAVFSVQGGLQWGGYWEGGYKEGFGEKLYMESGTGIDIDNMSIRLVANVPKGILTEILEDERSSLKALIRDTKQEIQKLHGFIELLQEDMARDPDKAEGISSAIADYKADISEKEKKLAKQLAAKPEKDWGIPDSLVWNDVRFYLWREGVLFIVEQSFSNSENEPGFSISNPYFQQLAKRLRYRKPNEIPKEIGLCIPYGFIEDDGTLTYEINTTFRYQDDPAVLYRVSQFTPGDQRSAGKVISTVPNEASIVTAGTLAFTSMLSGQAEFKNQQKQQIGPKEVKLGGVYAMQGGYVLKQPQVEAKYPYPVDKRKPLVDIYSVYTGYAGYVNSQIFPSQVVKMESFNPSFFPKLLNKAPAPFERNQKRLDELVRTMRIRTTEPLLPELR